MERVDCLVVGAGVVGLAVARALALSGREVMVLEAESGIGMGTSSRNSEVIHAGIYYPAGSLKARLCIRGKQLLYAYCAERSVPHRRCGKLIVASSIEQLTKLQDIRARAAANGVTDLKLLDRAAALVLEPALQCEGALLSPSTGIVDSHALMLSYQGDLENAGGMVVFHTRVEKVKIRTEGMQVTLQGEQQVLCRTFINAAGLSAPDLAGRIEGLPAEHVPRAYYAKGNYFSLMGRAPFRHLIYPVPEHAGLGVHLTLDLAGQAKFGPDVQWVDSPDTLEVDAQRGQSFYQAIRSYWPGLQDGTLMPDYAGIRPKISGPHELAADFLVSGPLQHGFAGLVNLFGIESPGLTSSLAIGELVASQV